MTPSHSSYDGDFVVISANVDLMTQVVRYLSAFEFNFIISDHFRDKLQALPMETKKDWIDTIDWTETILFNLEHKEPEKNYYDYRKSCEFYETLSKLLQMMYTFHENETEMILMDFVNPVFSERLESKITLLRNF
jgi:hypothetical protein